MQVEVCANSFESARNAQAAGADRVELCAELGLGGITPSYGILKEVAEKLTIPVHVLIRPRSGDFTYSEVEFEIMKRDILLCKELGFQGIVSGLLHSDYRLDEERTRALIGLARPLKFTFHRAFDWVKDPLSVCDTLEEMGVDLLLSSGQSASAPEGLGLLEALHRRSHKLVVMPGGGVGPDNVEGFRDRGFGAVHLSGTRIFRTLDEKPGLTMNSPKFIADDALAVSDPDTLGAVLQKVKSK